MLKTLHLIVALAAISSLACGGLPEEQPEPMPVGGKEDRLYSKLTAERPALSRYVICETQCSIELTAIFRTIGEAPASEQTEAMNTEAVDSAPVATISISGPGGDDERALTHQPAEDALDSTVSLKYGDASEDYYLPAGRYVFRVEKALDGPDLLVDLSGKATDKPAPPKKPCFVAGTKIQTPDGPKNIEQIKIRDKVYSYDINSGRVVIGTVMRTWITADTRYGKVSLGDGTVLSVTEEHPFFLADSKKYVDAKDLEVGQVVFRLVPAEAPTCDENPFLAASETSTAAGPALERVKVTSVDFSAARRADVYNFSVKNYVNYFAEGILVHNY